MSRVSRLHPPPHGLKTRECPEQKLAGTGVIIASGQTSPASNSRKSSLSCQSMFETRPPGPTSLELLTTQPLADCAPSAPPYDFYRQIQRLRNCSTKKIHCPRRLPSPPGLPTSENHSRERNEPEQSFKVPRIQRPPPQIRSRLARVSGNPLPCMSPPEDHA